MAAEGSNTTRAVQREGFLPIGVDTLCRTSRLQFDLFIRSEADSPPLLYRESHYPLEQDDLERLTEQGIHTLYIQTAKNVAYQRYLREVVLQNKDLSPERKFKVLRKANRAVFESAIRHENLDHMVALADDFGQHLTDVICDGELILSDLFSLMDHDYYTYTHVANVSTYCVALARQLGICGPSDLLAIATGALLHDIGKRQIPPSVLNKRGRLSQAEWQLIQQHPQLGFEGLCHREDLSWAQLMMVYQHHERSGGGGYPVGLVGREIHEWARICTIADVFDALTSERPYRKADRVEDVLEFLKERAGSEFDEEMVQCWIMSMRPKG